MEPLIDVLNERLAVAGLRVSGEDLHSEERYRELVENASDLVYTFDPDLRITSLNRLAERTTGYSRQEAVGMSLRDLMPGEQWDRVRELIGRIAAGEPPTKFEVDLQSKEGRRITLEVNPRLILREGAAVGVQAIARDITGRDVAEMELRQAQKLESVGRLAAGIAHEINTPMQFVGDNVRFLQESFGQMLTLMRRLQEFCDHSSSSAASENFCIEFQRLRKELDVPWMLEEIPPALVQTQDGVERVVTIVRAMKEFAHPESKGMIRADLNRALMNTLTVVRNELKYVAEVETDLRDLPPVNCAVGDINQVFLNLLINAAHAIGDVVRDSGRKGRIRVHSEAEDSMVLVSISDTGSGIPERIRERIFDPFFTTKEVGRGTGQGLAIARSIVDRHQGTLTFESTIGKGTTFYIRLPVEGTQA